jgi:hypothetical protein
VSATSLFVMLMDAWLAEWPPAGPKHTVPVTRTSLSDVPSRTKLFALVESRSLCLAARGES